MPFWSTAAGTESRASPGINFSCILEINSGNRSLHITVYFKDPHSCGHANIWSFRSKKVEYMPGNHLVVLFYDGFMWRMVPQLRLRTEIAHFEGKIGSKCWIWSPDRESELQKWPVMIYDDFLWTQATLATTQRSLEWTVSVFRTKIRLSDTSRMCLHHPSKY